MNIAFGHSNMDFDCFGSLLLVKKLFPDYRLVRSSRIHPAAQHMYYFYEEHFDFLTIKDISREEIKNIIIVDTCVSARVSEYFNSIRNSNPAIKIFDHHQTDNCDIAGAVLENGQCGATTSLLGKIAMSENLFLEPEEATIALTAIYADTGRLIYENVSRDDYEVSAWLLDSGASLRLVKSFLETVREDQQIMVLNQIRPIQCFKQGHFVLFSYLELDENVAGLSAVVEKIMEVQNPDVYFAVFFIPKDNTVLVISRSQRNIIDVNALLKPYGGGGHQFAASVKISAKDGIEFFNTFRSYIECSLKPAAIASEILEKDIPNVQEMTSLMDASMLLERVDRTACPVMDNKGNVTGIISLRDIMKGRKHGKMQAPVTAYMSKPVISAGPNVTMREIERIFFKHKINQLPILEDGKLLGVVTRWSYLQFQKRTLDGEVNKEL